MAEVLKHDTHATDQHHDVDDAAAWDGGKDPMKASYGKLMMWYFLVSDAFTFAGFLIAYGALRFSMPTWPEADFVFAKIPFTDAHLPLVFVTFMTFVLIISSVTMVRAVQEGARENKDGIVKWMVWTIVGGAVFLGCQAWEWTTLIVGESTTIHQNPFGRYAADGNLKNDDGTIEPFKKGDSYLLHAHDGKLKQHEVTYTSGASAGLSELQPLGPKQFGALFFFITGFHGFHVFSGVLFLSIIAINVGSGVYAKRKNSYEMVEKIGLYWHFVDLVWVFVFLVFYLL
jgi:cytochrome c oxidase subunit III